MNLVMNSIFGVFVIIGVAALVWFFQWKLPSLHPSLRNMGLRGLIHQWKNPPPKGKQKQ